MSAVKSHSLPTEIYVCENVCEIRRHSVSFPELAVFSSRLRQLRSKLGEESHQEFWSTFFRPLFRYVFIVSSTPLSLNDENFCDLSLVDRLKAHLARVGLIYPSFAEESRALLDSFGQIVTQGLNPLLLSIEGITNPDSETHLLVREMRFATPIEATLKSRNLLNISVVSSNQLRSDLCYDSVVILGRPSWYPEFVFSAPRARTINLISYSWLKSRVRIESAFAAHNDRHSLSRMSEGQEEYGRDEPVEDELLVELDLDALSKELSTRYNLEHEYDAADARLLSLDGGSFVFIEAGEKSKVLVIDPEGESRANSGISKSRLRRIPVSYVEPGTYVLLRTSGSGDYIIALADRLLGKNAPYVRRTQEHWKELLRQEVNKRGLLTTSVALLDLGSIRAEESNVRNWISRRNIKPEDKRDFTAILRLIGLEERLEEYWRNAHALTSAHLRAGAHIRRLLLTQVAKADLYELERTGTMIFELPETDAGSMTAYRVISISHETQKVPVSKLDEPFNDEGALWHG